MNIIFSILYLTEGFLDETLFCAFHFLVLRKNRVEAFRSPRKVFPVGRIPRRPFEVRPLQGVDRHLADPQGPAVGRMLHVGRPESCYNSQV